ncbi:winged helix-turn-helix domain-containing protein [Streptomyces sp. PanSC19]|uniref:winged helix-turn-helix domain-containing protein n=1 Tax=Streptomyces sp. PanSC19 TaxID=1520455 RepID=UPI0021A635B0|nr:winged helix-turn-helix domain-containing protein [Streptomyces sp. PanSC19]
MTADLWRRFDGPSTAQSRTRSVLRRVEPQQPRTCSNKGCGGTKPRTCSGRRRTQSAVQGSVVLVLDPTWSAWARRGVRDGSADARAGTATGDRGGPQVGPRACGRADPPAVRASAHPARGLYLLHRLSWSPQVPAHRAVEREEQAVARWRAEQRSRVRPCPMGWGGRWGRRGAGYVELDRPGRVVGGREAADPALSGAAAGWRDAGRT